MIPIEKSDKLIHGVRIQWLRLGKASKYPPIVLLHGLNDCSRTWQEVASLLALDREVFLPDLPGHGFSDRPDASYKLEWYATVIAEWMKELDIQSADLIGHSFGGGVSQMLLLQCRERIRRLILVSPGGLGREISFALRLASVPFLVERLGQPFMRLGTMIALNLVRDARHRPDKDEICRLNATKGSARAFSRTVRDIIDWRGQRRLYLDRVHEIPDLPPILVIWGERDGVIPAGHAALFANALSNVRTVVFEACGHYLHFEKPEEFSKTVLAFLDEKALEPAKLLGIQRGQTF